MEITGLKRRMSIKETSTKGDFHYYIGKYGSKDILLGQTGVGKRKAELAAEFIMDRYPASAVISFGTSGALVEDLITGDIVLSKALYSKVDDYGGSSSLLTPLYPNADMISMAADLYGQTSRLFQRKSITTTIPVGNTDEKLALNKAYGAEIVDMESYWIARIASERNIPFLSIRAISDCARDSLPPFDRFLGPEKIYLKKAIFYFLTHPLDLVRLFPLYRKTRQAEKNLTFFMHCLITRYEAN